MRGDVLLNITPFSSVDLIACIDLYVKVFNDPPWSESWTYATAKERLSDLIHTPKFMGFLLYEEDLLVGFIGGNGKVTDTGASFYIAEFFINPNAQGNGYGSKLLAYLEKELIRQGVCSVYLLTSLGDVAEKFYIRQGYVVRHDRIVMRKVLV